MAKCGNCNLEMKSKKQLVRHVLETHESAFVDGSEDLQAIQDELILENPKYKQHRDKALRGD